MKKTSTKIVIFTLLIAAGFFTYFSFSTDIDVAEELVIRGVISGLVVAIQDSGLAIGLQGEDLGLTFSYAAEDFNKVTLEKDGLIIDANYSDVKLNDSVEVVKEAEGLTLRILESNE